MDETKYLHAERRRGYFATVVGCLLLVATGIATLVWPVRAAIQLDYFDVLTIGETLRLQWGTVVETDLAAFEIYCKEEKQSLSAYHVIGTRLAQGNSEEGAEYQFDIETGIEPGVAYCFRLKEITIDGRRGDVLDFCGYGLNFTPDTVQTFEIPPTLAVTPPITPTADIRPTQVFTIVETPTVSLTPITFEIPPTTTQAIPTVAPAEAEPTETEPAETEPIAATPTVAGNGGGILVLPTETSTPIIAPSPTATPPLIDESALLTPTLDVSPAVTATAEPVGEQVSPLPSPVLTSASPESLTATLESTLPQSATITATITEENQSSAQQRAAMAEPSSAPTEGGDSLAGPSYIVLTATPSEAPMSIMPTFTPFPTAVAVAEGNVLGTTLQSQNLMILLLCGVFSGASGLGVLGVVTTLLYMRSRSSEERNS